MGFWKYAQEDPSYVAIVDPDGTEHAPATSSRAPTRSCTPCVSWACSRATPSRRCCPTACTRCTSISPRSKRVGTTSRSTTGSPHPKSHYILKDADAKAIVTHERFADVAGAAADEAAIPGANRLAHGTVPGFRAFSDAVDGQPTSLPEHRTTGAAMHYTSGTTGKPKGVKRPLNDLDPDVSAELFTFLLGLFGITMGGRNVHLCTSPNYHTAVTTFAGNSLHMKHAVVCMDRWDPEEALRLIERYRCTHTHMVPTQFIRMLQLPDEVKQRYDVSSMRWAIHAAGALSSRRENAGCSTGGVR